MRRVDRQITDPELIRGILEDAKIVRIALQDDGWPYIVPMHYGYELADGRLRLYLHCAHEGHKLDLLRRDSRCCVELDCGAELVSGGEIACRYGAAYRSLIGRGQITIVDDPAEAVHGLELLMRLQTGRSFDITPEMAGTVCVLRAELSDYTAKGRSLS